MTAGSSTTSSPGVKIITSVHHLRGLRTPLRVLTALATALALMVAVDAGSAAAATKPHLTAAAATTTVLTHGTVTVSGTVTPRGSGVRHAPALRRRPLAAAHPHSVSRTGSYSFAVKASATTGTTIYRVTRTAGHGAKALVSKTAARPRDDQGLQGHGRGARRRSPAARPIVVTGSVSPKAKGSVALQALQHGAWHTLATAKLSRRSTFSVSKVEPTGTYALRVRSPLHDAPSPAASASRSRSS